MFMFFLQYLTTGFEVCVEARHSFPEVVQRTFEEVVRNKEILFYVFLLDVVSGFTCQNHQFADHVFSAQVDTRVRFGIAFFLRHFDRAAERNVSADLIKDIVQCTRKYGFNLQYLITTVNQVVNGIDNRQSRTYVCFKQVLHTPLTGNRFQFAIVLVSRRCSDLIGCHYGNVVLQKVFVK